MTLRRLQTEHESGGTSGNCSGLAWNYEMVADEETVGYLRNQPQPAKRTF